MCGDARVRAATRRASRPGCPQGELQALLEGYGGCFEWTSDLEASEVALHVVVDTTARGPDGSFPDMAGEVIERLRGGAGPEGPSD